MLLIILFQFFYNYDYGFKINIKNSTEIISPNSNSGVLLQLGKGVFDKGYPTITITVALGKTPTKEGLDAIIDELKSRYQNFNLRNKKRFNFNNSKNAIELEGDFFHNGKKLIILVHYFMIGKNLFVSTGITSNESYDRDIGFLKNTVLTMQKIE